MTIKEQCQSLRQELIDMQTKHLEAEKLISNRIKALQASCSHPGKIGFRGDCWCPECNLSWTA